MKKIKAYFQLNHFLIVLLPLLFYSLHILAAPTVTNVSPLFGLSAGGDSVTITGTGFTAASQVLFGSTPAASFTVNGDTTITATTPSTVPGVVDITVTGPSGTSTPNQNDRFAFRGDGFAFLPDFTPGVVYTTDTATNFLNPNTITVQGGPNFVAISSDGRTAYCVNSLSNSISVIDVATLAVTNTINIGQSFPILMAVTQDPSTSHEIGYTSNYSSNTASQIDLTAGTVLQNVNVGAGPSGGIVTPALASVTQAVAYVTNTASSSISRIDFSSIPATVTTIDTNVGSETGSSPSFITLAPDGTTAYFTDDNPSQFAVKQLLNVNTTTPAIGIVITDPSFNFGGSALFPQIAITPPQVNTGDVFAYVTNTGTFTNDEAVTALNITDVNNPTVTCTLTAGLGPNGMAVTPDGSKAYICNASTSNLITILSGLPSCSPSGVNQVVGSTPTDPTITPDQAPLAYFTANPTNPVVNSSVSFDASASVSPMGNTMTQPFGIYSYTWDFGDGSSTVTLTTPTTTHTYTTTGTFTPTLTVTNLAGTSTSSTSYFNGQFFLRNAQDIASGSSAQYQVTLDVINSGNSTMTAVVSSLNPSSYGDDVTFTATVTGSISGTPPTGSVDFFDNGNFITTATLTPQSGSTSTADFSTSSIPYTLTGGTHIISAVYGGDGVYSGSSNSVSQVVNPLTTTTTITSVAPSPSIYGQSVDFTAHVTTTFGTLIGTVNFLDVTDPNNPILFATAVLNSESGLATASYSGLDVKNSPHSIVATYIPSPTQDPNHSTSTSDPVSQEVNPADTNTTVITSGSPSLYGQQVTFTATVSIVAPGGGALDNDFVSFYDGSTFLGSAVISGNQAEFTTFTPLSVGTHTIKAVFNDSTQPIVDPNFISSSNTVSQQVQDTTTTHVTSSQSPSRYGQSITFTATVTSDGQGGGTPTGSVQFAIDGTNFGSPVTLNNGTATSDAISTLSVAGSPHTITADYTPDTSDYTSSSRSTTQNVNATDTHTGVTSSQNPSRYGQSVTFTATVTPVNPGGGTPTGSVQFAIDGTNFGSPVTLSNGTATSAAISTLSVAGSPHSITVNYTPDTSNYTSSSGSTNQEVDASDTNTGVISSQSPSTYGQSVTFTATVTPVDLGGGTPTGSVQFAIDGVNFGSPVTLSNGTATSVAISTISVAGSPHAITASYTPDTSNYTSSSGSTNQDVDASDTNTGVTSSQSPSRYGQSITFTATVTPVDLGGGTPTGSVQFAIDGVNFGSPVTLSNGTATSVAISTISVAGSPHAITASYTPDTSNYTSSSGSTNQDVDASDTNTGVTSSQSPSTYGQSITFTATVTPVDPGGGNPIGSVQFAIDGTNFGSPVPLINGTATSAAISTINVGASHTITADYTSDTSNYTSSSGSMMQNVNVAHTTTNVASSKNPSQLGETIKFTATVISQTSFSGPLIGSVQFFINGQTFGTSVLVDANGNAVSSTISSLNIGSYNIVAVYSGDNTHSSSTSPSLIQIIQGRTTTAISASPPNSIFGQPVTFTATVTPSNPGGPSLTGTVQFFDGSTLLGTGNVDASGVASLTISDLSTGVHPNIVAAYSGDTHHLSSTSPSISYTVSPDSTTTTVTSSMNPSIVTQTVTFTATIAANSPGSGIPTGNVSFSIDGGPEILASLVNGQATLSTSNLTPGNHTISVSYLGDPNFTSSTGALTQQVNVSPTTVSVNSSQNPGILGQPVTFTATIHGDPNLGVPTGTVTFIIDGVTVSTQALVNGKASFQTSSLTAGQHIIVVVYSGDASHQGSTSDPFIETILAILPPRDLEVIQVKNKFASQLDRVNIITWKAPRKGEKPVAYRIYRDAELTHKVATIYASNSSSSSSHHNKLRYEDHNRRENRNYTYYIVSIDEFGNVSDPAKVIYYGKRK